MRALRLALDYFFVPALMWAGCSLAGFQWRGHGANLTQALFTGFVMLIVLVALCYQTGYMGYYKAGRKAYFYTVFIAPVVVGAAGLLIGLFVTSR